MVLCAAWRARTPPEVPPSAAAAPTVLTVLIGRAGAASGGKVLAMTEMVPATRHNKVAKGTAAAVAAAAAKTLMTG